MHPWVMLKLIDFMLKIDAMCLNVTVYVTIWMQDIVQEDPVLFHSTVTAILCQRSTDLLIF
jgi:hypothetical protein